ncbi:hypothetical protein [Halorarius litoreus]|uniref:hypothetical protein n=1 Tax=Halorarius litoreus TaxID=2962676 RepID=UPI0020CD396D|nr:hypothetical protein [Halorarius litoreus]
MRRRDALRAGLAVGTTALAGCTLGYAGEFGLDESFEGTFDWETAAHIGPEEPLSAFEWAIEPSSEEAHTGDRSLRVFTEGDHDDGTAWATHPVDVSGASRVRVSAWFWSESESFNTLRNAVMRLGATRPDTEEAFPPPETNTTGDADAPYGGLRESLHLQEGWREYAFEWSVPADLAEAFVAVGVSVVWESDSTHYIDDVRVERLD